MTNNELHLSLKVKNNELLMVGDSCRLEHNATKNCPWKSKWFHRDQTGLHVNRKKYFLWAFRTTRNDALVLIIDSKRRDVFKGSLVKVSILK
jgi:hypothetical protein